MGHILVSLSAFAQHDVSETEPCQMLLFFTNVLLYSIYEYTKIYLLLLKTCFEFWTVVN